MEFITAEQFQEQPLKVRKLFRDWWQPSTGDWYMREDVVDLCTGRKGKVLSYVRGEYEKEVIVNRNLICPLFTEGQLRKFIEDKKGEIVEINLYCGGYSIVTEYRKCEFGNLGKDLLQAYWKVACEIAKEDEVSE